MIELALSLVLAQEDAKIAEWVSQLSDDSIEVRDRAFQALVKSGKAAEKRLREAAGSADAELRGAAARALAEIERVAKFDAGPSLVTLRRQDAPLKAVLEEIAKQSRTRLVFKDVPGDDKVSVAFEERPLLPALEELCRGHGGIDFEFTDRWTADPEAVTTATDLSDRRGEFVLSIVRRKPGLVPRAVADQFAVSLVSVHTSKSLNFAGAPAASTTFNLFWGCEKGTRSIGATVVIEELKDEAGTSYIESFRKREEPDWPGFDDGSTQVSMPLIPPAGVRRFSQIKGRIEIRIPEAEEVFAFADPAARLGETVKQPSAEVKLTAYSRTGTEVKATVEVRPMEFYERLKIHAVGKDGKLYGTRGQRGSGDGTVMKLTPTFHVPEGAEVAEVRCSAQTGSRIKKVPFDFRGVRFR
jgi:hypothetical protein